MKSYLVKNVEPIQAVKPGRAFTMVEFLAEVLLDEQFGGNLEAMQLVASMQRKIVKLSESGTMTLTDEEHTALCKAIMHPTHPYRPLLAKSICLFGFAVVDARPS